MAKPTKPRWADGDPSYVIEPAAGKKATGWLSGEKPPFQYMNWIHYVTKAWVDYFESKVETESQTLVRSAGTLGWDGSDITFASAIQISFRVTTGEQINRIQPADSPLSFNDGQVLVIKKDKINASPVNLSSAVYAAMTEGDYSIVNESDLTAVDHENELIIFRRRGTNLEVVPNKTIYTTGSTIILGQATLSGDVLPIGSIIPFYDYNGALTFGANWAYCDGSVVAVGGIGNQTLPDLSNRYLVGFGTEAGGNIDSVAWETAAVGNASHEIALNHVHTGPSHSHGRGTYHARIAMAAQGGASDTEIEYQTEVVDPWDSDDRLDSVQDQSSVQVGLTAGIPIAGTSAAAGTGNTGSSLSANTNIQPRSIRVRFIMRIA